MDKPQRSRVKKDQIDVPTERIGRTVQRADETIRNQDDRSRSRNKKKSEPTRNRSRSEPTSNIGETIIKTREEENACQTNFRPDNLTIYSLANSLRISYPEINILNGCVLILQRQILDTLRLSAIGTDNNPCKQENLFCIKKTVKDRGNFLIKFEKNNGTIRAIGLFKKSEIQGKIEEIIRSGGNVLNYSDYNKLTFQDAEYKFAIPSFQGNPNGVLAMSLCEAASSLNPRGINKDTQDKITKLSDASRDVSDPALVDEILSKFITKISSDVKTNPDKIEDLLKTITKVYGPLVNKGLSDISQAGELAKYYILKYIEGKLNRTIASISCSQSDPVPNGNNFWNITAGLPNLVAFSSDAIASVLGVRIQQLFKGQFQSILPRKHGKGRYSVIYIPYEYIPLMYMLDNDSNKVLNGFKQEFSNDIHFLEGKYRINFSTSNYFSEEFLNKLRGLVDNIYTYFKMTTPSSTPDIGFSANIITIIDNIIQYLNSNIQISPSSPVPPQIVKLNSITTDYFNIYGQLYINSINASTGSVNSIQLIIDSLNIIKNILLHFGKMIENLQLFVNSNKPALLANAKKITTKTIEVSGWTGILYSTISYYDNCCDFSNKTPAELLKLYLNISETEESCAEQDVDYGHDQHKHPTVQQLGIIVARDWFNKEESIRSNLSRSQRVQIQEATFTKTLIDTESYFSVALTYDKSGKSILRVNITNNPNEDFIYNLSYSSPIASGSVINIKPIGNIEIWGSIDYTIGDPFINVTKSGITNLRNEEKIYKQFIEYFKRESIIEIRTPVTDFDAAAPSGCYYKTTEKMCVSYREFIPKPGSGVPGDGREYLFVIITLNLNDKSKNNLELTDDECLKAIAPPNIFNSGNELQRTDTVKELQIQFSRPFSEGTENQKEKLFSQKIKDLLENCYIKLETGFQAFLKGNPKYPDDLNAFLETINSLLADLNNYRAASKQGTKKDQAQAEKIFKEQAIPTFNEIINNISKYYTEYTECQESDCYEIKKTVMKQLLKQMYLCMFGEVISGEIDRVLLTFDKLNEKHEAKANVLGASALLFLAESNIPDEELENFEEQVATSDRAFGPANQGLNLLSTTLQKQQGLNKGLGELVQRQLSPEEIEDQYLVRKLIEDFTIGSRPLSQKEAKFIILDAYKKFFNHNGVTMEGVPIKDKYNWISTEYLQWHNDHLDEDEEPIFAKKAGGKRKTKKNNIYKNKIYKRKTKIINKKVRKTKKRLIKGKRITRRI